MNRILLTGSNGLLGQKLVELIAKENTFELIATARGANRLPASIKGYTYHSLDIENKAEVDAAFVQYKPDVVIHTAAMTNVDQCEQQKEACWQANVQSVRYLAEAAAHSNSFFLHLSTDFIFDGLNGPYTEEATAAPLSFYGYSKLAAEEIVKTIPHLRWSIARTVLVYGIAHDMSRTNIILWVKKSLEEKKAIKVVDDQFRTPTLAEDLAMGCYLIAQQKAEGIFNISGKELLTPYEMAQKTVNFFKLDGSYITKADSSTFTQPAKRPPRTGFILDKACAVLGYQPHSFDDGIAILAKQIGS